MGASSGSSSPVPRAFACFEARGCSQINKNERPIIMAMMASVAEPGAAEGRPGSASLSICNNCNGTFERVPESLPGPKKKQADAVSSNVAWMANEFGLGSLLFVTLTFSEAVHDVKEAQRRFHSFFTAALSKRYRCGVVVVEPQKSGRVHYHMVVAVAGSSLGVASPVDFRTGFDFEEYRRLMSSGGSWRGRDAGACDALKDEWRFFRENASVYGFGRCNCEPIKGDAKQISRYIGKYISKGWAQRLDSFSGARVVRYFGHWSKFARKVGSDGKLLPPMKPRYNHKFSWNTAGGKVLRLKYKQAFSSLRVNDGVEVTIQNVSEVFGPYWAWRFNQLSRNIIFSIDNILLDDSARHGVGVKVVKSRADVYDNLSIQNLRVRGRVVEAGGDVQKILGVESLRLAHFLSNALTPKAKLAVHSALSRVRIEQAQIYAERVGHRYDPVELQRLINYDVVKDWQSLTSDVPF